ncbi:MFS transporter [Salinicoccus roseus]|uniref:MFS transporter n=1 Tax=Salinicoccus roseus TaxID=45670 RepID=UPI00356983B3
MGWRFAWQFWGFALLLIFVPIVWIFIRNTPEKMGVSPDGLRLNTSSDEENEGGDIHVLEDSCTLKEASRTLSFWTLLICVGIPSMVNTGITFHIVSIFKENGLEMGASAMVLSLMAMVGIPMSFVSGLITDRIRTNYILVMIFLIEIILLLFLNNVTTYALAILFGVIWGMSNGSGRMSSGPTISADATWEASMVSVLQRSSSALHSAHCRSALDTICSAVIHSSSR